MIKGKYGQDAAAVRGHIGSVRRTLGRLSEIDSKLYDEGYAISHRRRKPLVEAINLLETVESRLNELATELVT